MDETVKWTQISSVTRLPNYSGKRAIGVSVTVVDQLLRKHNFRKRKAVDFSNWRERNIVTSNSRRLNGSNKPIKPAKQSVMSMDTKELIGQLCRMENSALRASWCLTMIGQRCGGTGSGPTGYTT
jgi:hypothetical protein